MNRVAIYRFLERGCHRLNPIRMAGAFLKNFIGCGIGFGILIFGLRIFGVHQANLGLWEFLIFSGGLTGWIRALRHQLGLIDAAYWLDSHLRTGETFSAAVICLDRNCSGMLDPFVIERAGKLAEGNPEIRWPLRNLIRQTAIALGLQIVFILLLALAAPNISWRLADKKMTENNYSAVIRHNTHQRTQPKMPGLPPRTIAEQLFPSDPRLAASLENALKTGDTDAIERLLGQAEMNSSPVAGDDLSTAKRNAFQAAKDYQQIVEEMERNQSAGRPGDPENGSRRSSSQKSGNSFVEQETQMTRAVRDGQQTGRNGPSNSQPQNGQNHEGMGSYGYGPSNDPRNTENYSAANQHGGNKPGNGRGNNDAHWGSVLPDGSGRKITIQPKGTTLEFVLPGRGTKIPLTQMAPAYQQANEAAMHRRGVPGEYQDYVRSYFKELSKETRLNDGNPENSTVSKEESK